MASLYGCYCQLKNARGTQISCFINHYHAIKHFGFLTMMVDLMSELLKTWTSADVWIHQTP